MDMANLFAGLLDGANYWSIFVSSFGQKDTARKREDNTDSRKWGCQEKSENKKKEDFREREKRLKIAFQNVMVLFLYHKSL